MARSRASVTELIEIEGLLGAVRAKAAGWDALLAAGKPFLSSHGIEPADVEALLDRARGQVETLSRLHPRAAARAFPAGDRD